MRRGPDLPLALPLVSSSVQVRICRFGLTFSMAGLALAACLPDLRTDRMPSKERCPPGVVIGDAPTEAAVGCGETGPARAGPGRGGCFRPCSQNSDCDDGSEACRDGLCRWVGCSDDSQCQRVFGDGYICPHRQGADPIQCARACADDEDCDVGIPLADADNARCSEGSCAYAGCNSDAECSGTFGEGYFCGRRGTAPAGCSLGCDAAEDCFDRLYPAQAVPVLERYDCVDGACVLLGCRTDEECAAGRLCRSLAPTGT